MQITVETLADPFAEAAIQVLSSELGVAVGRLSHGGHVPPEVFSGIAVLVGLTGDVKGLVALVMPIATAMAFAGVMMGEPVTELDAIGQSAVAELGNMVAGLATIRLEAMGCQSNITPPSVVTGTNTRITTTGTDSWLIPLETSHGALAVQVALKANAS
jgi:chemotaxis protein CheX